MKKILTSMVFMVLSKTIFSQCIVNTNIQHQSDLSVQFPLLQHDITAKRDSAASKPFLYIAGKERGLIIYDITSITAPIPTATIATTSLLNLQVMSLTQAGNYLYLALGDNFSATSQNSGMAIVDITNPSLPILKSTYSYTAPSGSGHVAIDGNYAYLSAMQNGIIVLDVTNKSSIQFVSIYKPNVNFPKPNPNSSELLKINARSIVVKNNILYLCYDAGGVRVIDATNKSALVQTGKYSNPLVLNKARAYNNLVLDDSLIYVAADYCGMEVLKVKDTSNIIQIGWWNPWKCETSANTWFNSPGYANEIEFDSNCKMLFISTGRSDLHAVSVANPLLPDSCVRYGNTTDSLGSWGLGRYNNQLYLSYIATWPLYTPFPSKWSGIKILTYNNACSTGLNEIKQTEELNLHPNPTNGLIFISNVEEKYTYFIYNALGQLSKQGVTEGQLDVTNLKRGIYSLILLNGDKRKKVKFVKED